MDETYIRVKGEWVYLYRAVDKFGKTIDFLLTDKRDQKAAKRFLTRAIGRNGLPEAINIDKSGANAAAIVSYNAEHGTTITVRKNKYLNNIVGKYSSNPSLSNLQRHTTSSLCREYGWAKCSGDA